MLNLLHNSDVGFADLEALEVTSDRSSLDPRPFTPPVFDCLQCANYGGGRPGRFGHVRLRKVDRR